MTNDSSTNTGFRNGGGAVIKPSLSGGLVVALGAFLVSGAILVIMLSRFDDAKRQAQEAEAGIAKVRTELSSLQGEVDSLTKQKDALAPHIVDWEKRLKEKAGADAFLATFEGKQRRAESDLSEAAKRLDEANRHLVNAEKQKTELNSEVETLKAERFSMAKSNTDAKAALAIEAERRLNQAQNALTNADARRKQLEIDASVTQTRFEKIQQEEGGLRQTRAKLNTELAALRQQIQTRQDQLPTFDQTAADVEVHQTAAQQTEQKSANSQEHLAIMKARGTEMESRQRQAASERVQLTNRLGKARSQAVIRILNATPASLQG